MSALVLLSGGLDSLAALADAKAEHRHVRTLVFDYGQRNEVELQYAEKMSERLCADYHDVIDLRAIFAGLRNAMTDATVDINVRRSDALGAQYVPNRNLIFHSVAATYAERWGRTHLYTGAGGRAPGGAPDSEPEFIDALRNAINTGNPEAACLVAPLYGLQKSQVWQKVASHGLLRYAVGHTYSCQTGGTQEHEWGIGCGNCPACRLREQGYKDYVLLDQKI